MSHVKPKLTRALGAETLSQYRANQMEEKRWRYAKKNLHVSEQDLANNFEFLNGAVLNRYADDELLLTTTGLFGPIRSGTMVKLDANDPNVVVHSDYAPMNPEANLINLLNERYEQHSHTAPSSRHALLVEGYWTAYNHGAKLNHLDDSSNLFGGTGQLICDCDNLNFPLLKFGETKALDDIYLNTLHYYGGALLRPGDEFAMGFNQDLWGVQYNQKLPKYLLDYEFSAHKAGGLFVEHHPFPHIWLPAKGVDPVWGKPTVSRIILGRRIDEISEDGYYRTVDKQKFHFSMFEIPNDGSALAVRPQCIHNDSFTQGAQTVFVGNTAANTVALRHSAPIKEMYVEGVPTKQLYE